MPQPTGYGDDDGDDKVLMVMWRMIIIIIIMGWKKRKAGRTNSTNTIIIVKKNRIIGPIDPAGRGKSVIIWLLPANSMKIFYHQIPTGSKEKNILTNLEYFLTQY